MVNKRSTLDFVLSEILDSTNRYLCMGKGILFFRCMSSLSAESLVDKSEEAISAPSTF